MPNTKDNNRPVTRRDLTAFGREVSKDLAVLAAELRGEMQAVHAEVIASFEWRTRALFFSQIASILAVALIALAD